MKQKLFSLLLAVALVLSLAACTASPSDSGSNAPSSQAPTADIPDVPDFTDVDTSAFLEEALATLGLTDQEANEFLIYWLPKMEGNPYNLIAFQDEVYTENAALSISPAPDTLLRVFMAWKPLDRAVELPPQTLAAPARTGFTVVEWGGAEVS